MTITIGQLLLVLLAAGIAWVAFVLAAVMKDRE